MKEYSFRVLNETVFWLLAKVDSKLWYANNCRQKQSVFYSICTYSLDNNNAQNSNIYPCSSHQKIFVGREHCRWRGMKTHDNGSLKDVNYILLETNSQRLNWDFYLQKRFSEDKHTTSMFHPCFLLHTILFFFDIF